MEGASPWPKATQQGRFGLSFLSKLLPLTPSYRLSTLGAVARRRTLVGGEKRKSTGRGLPTPWSPHPLRGRAGRSATASPSCAATPTVLLEPAPKQLSHIRTLAWGRLPTHEAPEEAFGNPWAAQRPLPAGATERLLGLYRDGQVSRALSPGWARGLCAWVARSAPRALLAPSLAFSFFWFLFFFPGAEPGARSLEPA